MPESSERDYDYPICLECGERHPTQQHLRNYVVQEDYTTAELLRNCEIDLNVPEVALVILGLEMMARDLPESSKRVGELTERLIESMSDM